MDENQISYQVIGIALEIHKKYGPGLLESAYENILAYELRAAGFDVKQQVNMPLQHKELNIANAYRIDLLVDNKVIIEVKAVADIHPVCFPQVVTYLKLSNLKLGLLINFNCELLKEGIHRIVNKI